jgi:hypothetical protein
MLIGLIVGLDMYNTFALTLSYLIVTSKDLALAKGFDSVIAFHYLIFILPSFILNFQLPTFKSKG